MHLSRRLFCKRRPGCDGTSSAPVSGPETLYHLCKSACSQRVLQTVSNPDRAPSLPTRMSIRLAG